MSTDISKGVDASNERATWREFTKVDWYGYAGAVPFGDGRQPLIAELRVLDAGEAFDAVAIIDAQGFAIELYEIPTPGREEGDFAPTVWACRGDGHPGCTSAEGTIARAAVLLKALTTKDELRALGFEEV